MKLTAGIIERLNFFLFLTAFLFLFSNYAIAGENENKTSGQTKSGTRFTGKDKWFYADTNVVFSSNFSDINKSGQYPFSPLVNPNEKPSWMLALATNPLNLIFNQIGVSLDVIRPKKSHEFRYNFIQNSTKLLWITADDGYSPPSIKYSGYQLSYTLKFVHQKPFDRYKYIYQGPQIRYTSRNYEEITAYMINKTTNDSIKQGEVISAGSQVFDLVFVTGQQVRWKFLFVDLYAGAGIGYKTMTASFRNGLTFENLDEYNLYKDDEFTEKETRFKSTRWNRIYVPTRAGIRVGILF